MKKQTGIRRTLLLLFCCALIISGCGKGILSFGEKSEKENTEETLKGEDEKKDEEDESTAGENNKPDNDDSLYVSEYDGSLGSAGALKGTTVIVSIFANDATTSWDFAKNEDIETVETALRYLGLATNWLATKTAEYDSKAQFVYDWVQNPDLRYFANFDESLVRFDGSMYWVQADYVERRIDYETIKQKYKADNIIYLFFFNTGFDNQVNPWALGYSNCSDYYIEYSNIYVRFDDYIVTPPASYAHEILHCFGAPDLYYSNRCISEEYVEHCSEICTNDIMYAISFGEEMIDDFTELDAYYVGLTSSSRDVIEWGLAESEHFPGSK